MASVLRALAVGVLVLTVIGVVILMGDATKETEPKLNWKPLDDTQSCYTRLVDDNKTGPIYCVIEDHR